jgi:hypothetical protein
MWRFEARIGDVEAFASGTWSEMREQARSAVEGLQGPERPTLLLMLGDATPDQPWSCAGGDCAFRIWRDGQPALGDNSVSTLTTLPDHGDREHADLGASSCYRWWNCPGSSNLTRKLKPPQRTTPAAEKGTAAHEVAHLCLLTSQDAIEMVGRVFNGIVVDEDMADDVQQYLDLCRSFVGPDAECFTEKKFNLKKLDPPAPMFGTSDFGALILKLQKLIIVDYKNGYLPVEAQGNPQLKYYVLGVICSLPETARIKDIEVYIVQPNGRGPKVKVAHYMLSEIFTWHLDLMKHARATQDPDAPLKAGSWCKFCPNAGLCKVQAEANMEAAQLEFVGEVEPGTGVTVTWSPPEISGLSPKQIGALLLKFEQVEDFMKSTVATAKALIDSESIYLPGS